MAEWKKMFEYIAQDLELIFQRKSLSYTLTKNIREEGDCVEHQIRELFRKFLPGRLKVTSGHIVASNHPSPPMVSPQVDLIIVDTMVPHSLSPFSDNTRVDFVPIEAVVGIFEVKASVSKGKGKQSIFSAVDQLRNIAEKINLTFRDNRYLPGGMQFKSGNGITVDGGAFANPMLGLISLTGSKKFKNYEELNRELQNLSGLMRPYPIDLILVCDGLLLAPSSSEKPLNFFVDPARNSASNLGVFGKSFGNNPTAGQVVAKGLGIIQAYLQEVVGRHYVPTHYFSNFF